MRPGRAGAVDVHQDRFAGGRRGGPEVQCVAGDRRTAADPRVNRAVIGTHEDGAVVEGGGRAVDDIQVEVAQGLAAPARVRGVGRAGVEGGAVHQERGLGVDQGVEAADEGGVRAVEQPDQSTVLQGHIGIVDGDGLVGGGATRHKVADLERAGHVEVERGHLHPAGERERRARGDRDRGGAEQERVVDGAGAQRKDGPALEDLEFEERAVAGEVEEDRLVHAGDVEPGRVCRSWNHAARPRRPVAINPAGRTGDPVDRRAHRHGTDAGGRRQEGSDEDVHETDRANIMVSWFHG